MFIAGYCLNFSFKSPIGIYTLYLYIMDICIISDDSGCDVCAQLSSTEPFMMKHRKRKHPHTDIGLYKCQLGLFSDDDVDSFQQHLSLHRRSQGCQLQDIDHSIEIDNRKARPSCFRDAPREKPYKCHNCGAKFARNSDIKTHMRAHTGEKPFKCDTCGAKFAQSSNLKKHIRTHTGEKPYKCDTCGAQFAQSAHLKLHLRTHTGEKPYKCDTCGAQFAQSAHLKLHLRTHTGEKPYKCDTCGAQFAHSASLKLHLRTHTGEKPYKCDTCGAKFAQSANLKRHMRTHTGEKPIHVI